MILLSHSPRNPSVYIPQIEQKKATVEHRTITGMARAPIIRGNPKVNRRNSPPIISASCRKNLPGPGVGARILAIDMGDLNTDVEGLADGTDASVNGVDNTRGDTEELIAVVALVISDESNIDVSSDKGV